MKKLFLLCGLSLSMILAGCQSTSGSGASGSNDSGDDVRPAFSMTVAANSLSSWPITGEIKFSYKNGNENNTSLFTNMDPGVDTKQKGTLKIEVYDLLTKKVVWEGIIQAYSDYPVISAKNKQHAARLFVNQLTQRLPMVDR